MGAPGVGGWMEQVSIICGNKFSDSANAKVVSFH